METYRDTDSEDEGNARPTVASNEADIIIGGNGDTPKLYRALYDFVGDDDDLSFKAGDVICVSELGPPESWW